MFKLIRSSSSLHPFSHGGGSLRPERMRSSPLLSLSLSSLRLRLFSRSVIGLFLIPKRYFGEGRLILPPLSPLPRGPQRGFIMGSSLAGVQSRGVSRVLPAPAPREGGNASLCSPSAVTRFLFVLFDVFWRCDSKPRC